MRRSDLREIAEFGWLEEGAGAAGMFFVSGAFWLLMTLLAEHSGYYSDYAPWFVICVVCMLFGAALLYVAHRHFKLREERITDYFSKKDGDASTPQ